MCRYVCMCAYPIPLLLFCAQLAFFECQARKRKKTKKKKKLDSFLLAQYQIIFFFPSLSLSAMPNADRQTKLGYEMSLRGIMAYPILRLCLSVCSS